VELLGCHAQQSRIAHTAYIYMWKFIALLRSEPEASDRRGQLLAFTAQGYGWQCCTLAQPQTTFITALIWKGHISAVALASRRFKLNPAGFWTSQVPLLVPEGTDRL
jgi:hypothetical protein